MQNVERKKSPADKIEAINIKSMKQQFFHHYFFPPTDFMKYSDLKSFYSSVK